MPVTTVTTVHCDRCKREIPSKYVWPYTFGPQGIMQSSGNICADLPNPCKDVIQAVFFNNVSTVAGLGIDSL
jgi:hypothetical protein